MKYNPHRLIYPFIYLTKIAKNGDRCYIYGVRFLNQFFFKEELERELGINYIRCCSNEQSPNVFQGRITNYISQMDALPENYMYYLCGGGMMVIDVRDLLIEKGIPFGNILSEIYF